jgi:hypothetical protein
MASVDMPPVRQAVDVFKRLGYSVSDENREFQARRKWRTVRVTVLDSDEATATRRALTDGGRTEDASFRCFVTWKEYAGAIRDRLESADLGADWAVIGVDDAGDYDVHGV